MFSSKNAIDKNIAEKTSYLPKAGLSNSSSFDIFLFISSLKRVILFFTITTLLLLYFFSCNEKKVEPRELKSIGGVLGNIN